MASKILENDLLNKGVLGMADKPGLSAKDMQYKFEEIQREIIIPKLNEVIGEVGSMLSPFDNEKTYAVGEYCIYKDELYKCIDAVTIPGTWNDKKWGVTTLSDALKDLQSQVDNAIKESANAVAEEAAARKAEIAIERARIDSIAKLPEGSTTGDAELIDGRVDYKGNTHTNIGEHIREVSSQLSSEISNLETDTACLLLTEEKPKNLIKKHTLIPNHYVGTNGNVAESDAFYLTPFISIKSSTLYCAQNVGLSCFYDSNKKFINFVSDLGMNGTLSPSNASFIRCDIPTYAVQYAILCENEMANAYDDGIIVFEKLYPQKKKYESGYIRFTVPVNQSIFDYTTTDDAVKDSENLVNVECILTLPTSYSHVGKPTKLLMLCHGAGKGVSGDNNWTENADYCNIVNGFVSNGYAVFDCNGYDNTSRGHNFWGAQRGIEAWRKAYQYVVDNYNVQKNFSIYGFSMGGCTALNLAFQKMPNINSIVVASPVIDLEACFNRDIGCASDMSYAYGYENANGGFSESMRLQSPINRIVTFDNVDYCFNNIAPIRIYYGGNEVDQNGVEKQYAIRLHNAIKNAGGYSEYREVAGRGHEICYGADNNVIVESVFWFNRYSN